MERHCPLQIELGKNPQKKGKKMREKKEPRTGFRTLPNIYEDNLFFPSSRAPSSPLSRLMLLYLKPSPRIRGVETTSRHFVCADRPSETEGDNREKERLRDPRQPLREPPGDERVPESCPCYPGRKSVTKTDKTSVGGKPSR